MRRFLLKVYIVHPVCHKKKAVCTQTSKQSVVMSFVAFLKWNLNKIFVSTLHICCLFSQSEKVDLFCSFVPLINPAVVGLGDTPEGRTKHNYCESNKRQKRKEREK